MPPQEGRRYGWLTRAERFGRWLEDALLIVLLTGLILLASAQILLRNFFSIGFTWGDGLVRLAVLWLALLGAMAASRDRKHIAIDVVSRFLPPRLRTIAAIVMDWFAALVSGLLAWYGWSFVRDSRAFDDRLLGDLPAWTFQSILPVAFALISYRYLVRSLQRFRGDRMPRTDAMTGAE